ncbi:hypothetical protein DFH09DRAFT_1071502 [Mycena vulgaris]|nr:hypothetical protein DFH09DRAFT_1071502 [Mycena vulgaris]
MSLAKSPRQKLSAISFGAIAGYLCATEAHERTDDSGVERGVSDDALSGESERGGESGHGQGELTSALQAAGTSFVPREVVPIEERGVHAGETGWLQGGVKTARLLASPYITSACAAANHAGAMHACEHMSSAGMSRLQGFRTRPRRRSSPPRTQGSPPVQPARRIPRPPNSPCMGAAEGVASGACGALLSRRRPRSGTRLDMHGRIDTLLSLHDSSVALREQQRSLIVGSIARVRLPPATTSRQTMSTQEGGTKPSPR